LKTANKIIKKLSGVLNGISCAALTALMVMITLNVILRTAFHAPIAGAYDYTGFLTTIIIGCGLAYCNIENGHIDIGLLVDKIKGRTHGWIIMTGQAFSIVVLVIFAYSSLMFGTRLLKANELSITTKTPLFIFAYVLTGCFLVFALTILVKMLVRNPEGESI
jgi:TRAP-type C4-dicarboxylate transport system permease small subunit